MLKERCGQCSKHVLSPAFLPAHCRGTIFANTLVKCREEWLSNEKRHNDNLKESPPEMARKGLWGPFSVWGMWNSKSVRQCLIRVHRKDLRKVFTQISPKCWKSAPEQNKYDDSVSWCIVQNQSANTSKHWMWLPCLRKSWIRGISCLSLATRQEVSHHSAEKIKQGRGWKKSKHWISFLLF